MFKVMGNFLNRSPWWALILGGIGIVVALGLFTVPFNVLNLEKSGENPAQRRSIQREIHTTIGQSVLAVAERVVGTLQRNTNDPVKQAELSQSMKDIAEARVDLESAVSEARLVERIARDSARKASREASAAIEDARKSATKALKRAGFSEAEIQKVLDEAFKAAKIVEPLAIDKPPKASVGADGSIDITIGRDPGGGGKSKGNAFGLNLSIDGDEKAASDSQAQAAIALPVLPPSLRDDIRSRVQGDVVRMGIGTIAILLFIPLFFVALIAKFFIHRARAALRLAELKKNEAQFHNIKRQMTEAKLQALQAQVEPHFLYNTLANVQALIEVDAPSAHKMIGHLIAYLRAALPKMRDTTSTVGQELELVRAYLNILKMRMATRLEFAIEMPADIESQPFPPLMLPSLVENAIKHGLEPQRDGGRIDIDARVDGEKLTLSVCDNGRGLSDNNIISGGGVGLSNIRERLLALYGGAATFTLEENLPQGCIARIVIPLKPKV